MAPTYFCRFPGSQLRRPSRLRTSCAGLAMDFPSAELPIDQTPRPGCAAKRWRARDALPAPRRAPAAAEAIAARPFPVADRARHHRVGLLPMKSEINPLPLLRKLADAGARARAAGGRRPRPAADHAGLGVRRAARLRRLGHPRADAGRARGRSRYSDRAAAGLRSPRPSHRLRRRLLRHDDRAPCAPTSRSSPSASPSRRRKSPRFRQPPATPASISC